MVLGTLFEQAHLVKIVLPPTREPYSGGSSGSEKLTFSIMFWHVFLEADFSSIFIDFGLHFCSSLAPWEGTFDHHFFEVILDSDFGGPRDQQIRKVEGPAAGAEACGNQFLADFGNVFLTPGALPRVGAADLRRLRRVPAAALEASG